MRQLSIVWCTTSNFCTNKHKFITFYPLFFFSGTGELSQVLWILSHDLWTLEELLPDLSDHFGVQGKAPSLLFPPLSFKSVKRALKQFLCGTGRLWGWLVAILWREWTRPWRLYLFGSGARQAALQVMKTVTNFTHWLRFWQVCLVDKHSIHNFKIMLTATHCWL